MPLCPRLPRGRRALLLLAVLALGPVLPALAAGPTLLNVSDDVSREFYKDYHTVFAALEQDHR
jgi:sulfate/thiosulfate transport system substrate-binding protein